MASNRGRAPEGPNTKFRLPVLDTEDLIRRPDLCRVNEICDEPTFLRPVNLWNRGSPAEYQVVSEARTHRLLATARLQLGMLARLCGANLPEFEWGLIEREREWSPPLPEGYALVATVQRIVQTAGFEGVFDRPVDPAIEIRVQHGVEAFRANQVIFEHPVADYWAGHFIVGHAVDEIPEAANVWMTDIDPKLDS
jgi:hypothetical protein